MNPFYFAIGGLVWLIALFKRDLLVRKKSFGFILGLSVALFIVGLVYHFAIREDFSYGAFFSPLVSLALFRVFRRIFLKYVGREPRDTFLNWKAGLDDDRIFNITYFVFAALVWMSAPFIVQQLAKAW